MKRLTAILIGINDYPSKPLNQCVNDVTKVERYLKSLNKHFEEIKITKLINKEARKKNIVSTIKKQFITNDNIGTAVLYYSGHGAQEINNGLFPGEFDGLLECMVCSYEDEETEDFLLADKELRFLFSKIKDSVNLLTIFDSCHSGDLMRNAFEAEAENENRKRLSKSFANRAYKDFIFSQEFPDPQIFKTERLEKLIPAKNHIHIAACLSSESSWEDKDGGVFTRYLLAYLNTRDSAVSYFDIARHSKISLKEITKKQQTPIVEVIGKGLINKYSNWLGLDIKSQQSNKLIYNKKLGWHYTQGLLMGIKSGADIEIELDTGEKHIAKVVSADLDHALIEDPFVSGIALKYEREYKAFCICNTYNNLSLSISNIDNDIESEKKLIKIIKSNAAVQLVSTAEASFEYVIFNQCIYPTKVNNPFRPLCEQINLLDQEDFKSEVDIQISHMQKWNHFESLSNPGSFEQLPLSIELDEKADGSWRTVNFANESIELSANQNNNEVWYTNLKLRLKNISTETIFVACLTLDENFEIGAGPFNGQVIELQPNKSKELFEDLSSIPFAFPKYKEVYNWKENSVQLKFIVSNTGNFENFIEEALQAPLDEPLLIASNRGAKSSLGSSDLLVRKDRWDVITSRLKLSNPRYNIVSDSLKKNWSQYIENELLAPFIAKLYFENKSAGFDIEAYSLENAEAVGEKDVASFALGIVNSLDDKRRLRKFKRAKKALPAAPIIVAEGDSWFLFPFLVKDTLDYVMESFPCRSLAKAGAELQSYKNSGKLLKEIEALKPKYVMISGGGNDVVGSEVRHILKANVASGQNAENYLKIEVYKEKRARLMELYTYFFKEISIHQSVKQVFVHGYAPIKASYNDPKVIKKGWVNKYMIEAGMNNDEDRNKLIHYLVDNFNEDLAELASKYDRITYIDMRNEIGPNQWYDEIHPSDEGFQKIADKFVKAIKICESS